MPASEAEFGVYVHWPFCLQKCPYCDFNSHVRDAVDQARWRKALLKEVDQTAALTPGRKVTSIFFGGGTPSLMAPETAGAVIERIGERWGFSGDVEITLEANPTSIEAGRFRDFQRAGINRASVGVQALNDPDLQALGRGHSADEARDAVALARDIFPRFSFDLIYTRPGQTAAQWEAELGEALDMAGDHLSLYQLTMEPGTAFHAAWRAGVLKLPDEDTGVALYERTQQMCEAAGLPAYEISNHARPGGESHHNMTYWRYGEYAGVGPGAHGRLHVDGDVIATANRRKPESWLALVEAQGDGRETAEPVPPADRAEEMIMMGLRTNEGVNLAWLEALAGQPFGDVTDREGADRLIEGGLLEMTDSHLRATSKGRPVLNAVIEALLA